MADLIRHPGQDFFEVTPPEDCRLEEQIGQRFGAERSEGRVELVEVAVHVRRALGAQVVDGGAPRLKARCKDHLADSLLAVIREVAVTRVDLVQIREELRRSQDGREVQVGVDLGGHVKVGVITPCLDVLEPLLRDRLASEQRDQVYGAVEAHLLVRIVEQHRVSGARRRDELAQLAQHRRRPLHLDGADRRSG